MAVFGQAFLRYPFSLSEVKMAALLHGAERRWWCELISLNFFYSEAYGGDLERCCSNWFAFFRVLRGFMPDFSVWAQFLLDSYGSSDSNSTIGGAKTAPRGPCSGAPHLAYGNYSCVR
jgi:hypothetical protein